VDFLLLSCVVRVVSSVVKSDHEKSDHKAVVVLSSGAVTTVAKRRCRPRTPSQNASLLKYLATSD